MTQQPPDNEDALEAMRRKAAEQEENLDPLATLSDQEIRFTIGRLNTLDRDEYRESRRGDTLESATHHYDLLIAEAEAIEADFPASQVNRLRRSRGDMPEWANRGRLAQAQELLQDHRGEQSLLKALKAEAYPPTTKEHFERSAERKQAIAGAEAELTRRQLQRREAGEAQEAERVAQLKRDQQQKAS